MTDETTDFLYPMVDGTQQDASTLLDDLARSAAHKAQRSAQLTMATLEATGAQLDDIATASAERFAAGGRLFTCGNGGSATDAEGVAAMFWSPPADAELTEVRSLPARSLVADVSVLTALSNDIGFDVVFSRQIIAHARDGDIVMGFSTSGNSANVIKAFEEGHRRGLLTVGFAGNEGGAMARCAELDHCLVVRADSVHRIQETQSATAHELWRRVQRQLAGRQAA